MSDDGNCLCACCIAKSPDKVREMVMDIRTRLAEMTAHRDAWRIRAESCERAFWDLVHGNGETLDLGVVPRDRLSWEVDDE